jgi:hypothetical protein
MAQFRLHLARAARAQTQAWTPGPLGAWLFRATLIGLGLLIPFVVLELGFRFFGPFLPGEYRLGVEREFDPVLGWRNTPGFRGGARTSEFTVQVAINSHGLRDEERPYARPPGGRRILVLGDSFVAAAHVNLEQMMSKQLQGLLRAGEPARPIEVVNAGVSGYGQAQEYLYLDTEGFKYSPDLVVVVVFLGNDLIDNVRDSDGRYRRPQFNVDGDERLVQVASPDRPRKQRAGWDDFLLRNSPTYNFLLSGVVAKLETPAEQSGETGEDAGQDFQIYERDQSQKLRRAWKVTEALLAAIAKRSADLGARTLVIGAPSFRQLDPARFETLLRQQRLDPADYDSELPNRLLAAAADRRQLAYLDLLPSLRQAEANGQGPVFYPVNSHWAPPGQRAVAEAVARAIAAQELLPPFEQ